MTIRELESKILALPFLEKLRILQLLLRDFSNAWWLPEQSPTATTAQTYKDETTLPLSPEPLTDTEFEALADQLADEWLEHIGTPTPSLSDNSISRAGIYEEHP